MAHNDILVKVDGLKKHFPIKKGFMKKVVGHARAVDDVSFTVKKGETLGVVGESGCGKTTTGRCVTRLYDPTAGSITYNLDGKEVDITNLSFQELKGLRKHFQIIFQDPFSSLDPRLPVRDLVAEPLEIHKIGNKSERYDRVRDMLKRVGLRSSLLKRYPHEFSGGQRQRLGIARALVLNPELIVCDEPVSALDVSVQAQILNLLEDLQEEFGLTYIFVAHDLSVVEHISDRVAVMYLGKIVELAKASKIYEEPRHPYTEALLAAIPIANPHSSKRRVVLHGNVPSPINPPSGCAFHTRCSYTQDICTQEDPLLQEISDDGHLAACHFTKELQLNGFSARQ